MADVNTLIKEVSRWIGYIEKASDSSLADFTQNAGDKNYTYFADWMSTHVSKAIYANGNRWCDCFVDFIFCQAFGIPKAKELLGGWSAYTPTSAGYFMSRKQWFEKPQPGDVVFFKNSGRINHTGIVIRTDSSKVYTVEGNTSAENNTVIDNGGCVADKYYSITNPKIAGYGRPKHSVQIAPQSDTGVKCVDVSSYQGKIDWNKVKTAGIDNAILKIIRKDGRPDDRFESYYQDCKQAGIRVTGVYNYSYALTSAEASLDAAKVLKVLGPRSLKVWLDLEDSSQKNLGPVLADIINSYRQIIESSGRSFGVYTGLSFYNTYLLPQISRINCRDWWIARYYRGDTPMPVSDTPNALYKPALPQGLWAWQYTSSGKVDGIIGKADLSLIYATGAIPESPTESSDIPVNTPGNPDLTEKPLAQLRKVTAAVLNIRSAPSADAVILGSYKQGDVVLAAGETANGWYHTDKGYIRTTYATAVTGEIINTSLLNMRSEPGTAGGNTTIIRTLKGGDQVTLLVLRNGWYLITAADGVNGWIAENYVRPQ